MSTILFVFVGMMCLMLGVRVFFAEERTKVFNKRPITVLDVRKYNRACGALILGFGAVAEITIYFMIYSKGWISSLFTFGIVVEAVLVMVIYSIIEKKYIKKQY